MGFNFRKSFKLGPARINLSKSGVGYSVGAKGFRFTKRAGSKKKSDKNSGGFLANIMTLTAFVVAVCLVISYWQWVIAILAILAIGAVGYWIYIQRQIHPPKNSVEEPEAIEPPVPDSDT